MSELGTSRIRYSYLPEGTILPRLPFADIDIEILFCVEYCTTCNISPVGLLLRQRFLPNLQVIKLFFMLNSAEHEIYLADKC